MATPRPKTPLIIVTTRVMFTLLFAATFILTWLQNLPNSELSYPWLIYLIVIYLTAEYIYHVFAKRGIDLAYAFPLLFAIFLLNFVSLLLDGQYALPDLNRAEHLTSFVFAAYIVWTFFTKYLPHDVWQDHPYYTSILVLAVVSMFGVGNEIAELFFDVMFGTRTVGAGFDTTYDLVMNTLGAGLFLAFRLIYGLLNEKN